MKTLVATFVFVNFCFAAPSHNIDGFKIDSKMTVNEQQAHLSTGKKEDKRFYRIVKIHHFNTPIKNTVALALNFNLRCNNKLKDLRILTSKDFKCPLSSDGIIESQVIKTISNSVKQPHEIDKFIVQNRIKKRGELFTHVDLVTVYRQHINQLETYTIHIQMLTDDDARKYYNKAIERNSVFTQAEAILTFTEQENHRTKLTYDYKSETDHWLLNKSIITSRFFEGMLKSTQRIISAITQQI